MRFDPPLFLSSLYALTPRDKQARLLSLLKEQMLRGATRNTAWRSFLEAQPRSVERSSSLEELPFLPVSVFKRETPLSFLPQEDVYRVLSSSATTGQVPSRIALDRETARLMSLGVTGIFLDFLGSARCPYLVVDAPPADARRPVSGARGAAVQALRSFASEVCYALRRTEGGELELDQEAVRGFCSRYREEPVRLYGFTFLVWQHLGPRGGWRELQESLPKATVVHSGGWKKLQELAVSKETFTRELTETLTLREGRVLDYYGLVEHLGVVYPDCSEGHKHAPWFSEVILRRPLDWAPCRPGESGLLQVLSALAPCFPGQSLLTEDVGTLVLTDGCACGRRGTAFRFAGRVPHAEARGCSDTTRRAG